MNESKTGRKHSVHVVGFAIVYRTILVWVMAAVTVVGQEPAIAGRDAGQVIRNIAELMRSRYVSNEVGERVARQLEQDLAAGLWDQQFLPERFSSSVTARLRELTGDGHLGLDYSAKPLPEATAERVFSAEETERFYGAHLNYGFQRVERLDGNIGFLDLRVFAPVSAASDVASAAMTLLAQSEALIIDLRQNGGGHGEMAAFLAAYLFHDSRPLSGSWHRPTNTHTKAATPASVPGRRFGPDKPVFVLISRKTFSAAESFAYDLQVLKRAKIVGERSGGGAHPFEYRRVHPHFMLSLAEGRSVNPITGGNWQDTGIQPDVEVEPGKAFEVALELARKATSHSKPTRSGSQRRE